MVIGTVQAPADGQLTPREAESLAEWTKFNPLKSAAKFLATHGTEELLKGALKKMWVQVLWRGLCGCWDDAEGVA